MNLERPGGRFARWLLALLSLTIPLLVAYTIIHQSRIPLLGFLLSRGDPAIVVEVLVGQSDDGKSPQPGDAILSADGVPFASWNATQLGRTYLLEIERDGQRLTMAVPTVTLAQATGLNLISASILSLTLSATGTLLLWRRFRQGEVRLLFLLTQSFCLAFLPGAAYQPLVSLVPRWIASPSILCFHLAPPLFLHYQLSFPVRLGTSRPRRWGLSLAYVLGLLAGIANLFDAGLWKQLAAFYSVSVGLSAIGVSVYVYMRRSSPADRRRLRLVFAGTILGLVPPILGYALPSIVLNDAPTYMPEWLVGAFLLIIPASLLLAAARHNLFGIDRLLNRTLVYFLLSVGIFVLYLGPFLLVYSFLQAGLWPQLAVVATLTLLVGVGFDWARTRVQRLADRLFYGGWYDYPGVVEEISDALTRTLEREQLNQVLTHRVPELMQLSPGKLWIGEPSPAPQRKAAPSLLQYPLSFQGQVHGLWTVAPHLDGEDFSGNDRRILGTVARQAETALGNVLLVETLRGQLEEIRRAQQQLLRTREEERARLARDLHDGPIQSLVGLNLQLGLLLASEPSALTAPSASPVQDPAPLLADLKALRAEVRTLLNDLRAVCAELRPPVLDTLGLGAALRALATDWSAQHGVTAHLESVPDGHLRSLPDEVAVNLYRVVQEALANVARHAHASEVNICLLEQDGSLVLTIQDDGCGFSVLPPVHDLANRGHFGLAGMKERIDLIGGSWILESVPGKGTIVRVAWKPESPSQR